MLSEVDHTVESRGGDGGGSEGLADDAGDVREVSVQGSGNTEAEEATESVIGHWLSSEHGSVKVGVGFELLNIVKSSHLVNKVVVGSAQELEVFSLKSE
jgi:hypothetical protein